MALPGSQNPALILLPNLLLILAVATGIVITEPSLPNDRKLRPVPEAEGQGEQKNRDSYFWDDPFKNIIHVTDLKSPKSAPDKKQVVSGVIVPAPPPPGRWIDFHRKDCPCG